MWSHARRQMLNSLTRLVAAGLAIVLGTAFIAATMLSSEVIEATTRSTVSAELHDADLVVSSGWDTVITDGMVHKISDVPGIGEVHPQYMLPETIEVAGNTRYVELRNAPPVLEVSTGELPSGSQVAVSQAFAERVGLSVGDTVQLGDSAGPTVDVRISGLVPNRLSMGNEVLFGTTDFLEQRMRALGWPESLNLVLIYPDQPADSLVQPVLDALGSDQSSVTVQTAEQYTDRQIEMMLGDQMILWWFGLAFAALAIIVAGLVIANTFEVLVAQRTRTLAMLRCVGASRGQVRSSVLIEALVLGVVASVVGALVGLGFGQATVWFLSSRDLGVAVPRLTDISPWVLIVPILVGVLVTLVAASGPARAATKVSPVAALRPTVVEPVRGGGRGRLVLSLLLIIGGGLLLAGAVAVPFVVGPERMDSALIGVSLFAGILGGLVSLVGVLVGGVFVVPLVIRLLGRVLAAVVGRDRRATVRLATANAIRNPRRSATTASALVIGVTLVVLMGTGAASARASLDNALGGLYMTDVLVSDFGGPGDESESVFTADTVEQINAVPGVTSSVLSVSDQAWLSDGASEENGARYVVALDPQQARGVIYGADKWPTLRTDEVLVPEASAKRWGWTSGDTVQLNNGGSTPVTVVVSDKARLLIVTPETYAKVAEWRPNQLLVDVDEQADLEVVVDDISTIISDGAGYVYSPARERAAIDQVINALLAVIIGLLGVSVVIALVGVANTLSLSVLERRREHGVLRAVGVTKGQLRGMLSIEGVLLALTGALIGVVLGMVYGWAGSAIVLGFSGSFTLGVAPGITLGALAVGLVAGLIASVTPARSAIKVPPVVALSTE